MESQTISLQRPATGDTDEPKLSYTNGSLQPKVEIAAENCTLEWKLGRKEKLVMIALVIVSFVAALDATILVPLLPVRYWGPQAQWRYSDCVLDSRKIASRKRDQYLLGRNILFIELHGLSTFSCFSFRQLWSAGNSDALDYLFYGRRSSGLPGQ